MVDIVYCCDNNYVPYVGISMVSFLENNFNNFNSINVPVVEDNISKKYKNKLKKIIQDFDNVTLSFYKFNLNNFVNTNNKSNYSNIVYSSLFCLQSSQII